LAGAGPASNAATGSAGQRPERAHEAAPRRGLPRSLPRAPTRPPDGGRRTAGAPLVPRSGVRVLQDTRAPLEMRVYRRRVPRERLVHLLPGGQPLGSSALFARLGLTSSHLHVVEARERCRVVGEGAAEAQPVGLHARRAPPSARAIGGGGRGGRRLPGATAPCCAGCSGHGVPRFALRRSGARALLSGGLPGAAVG
jgi:hypothetical protein